MMIIVIIMIIIIIIIKNKKEEEEEEEEQEDSPPGRRLLPAGKCPGPLPEGGARLSVALQLRRARQASLRSIRKLRSRKLSIGVCLFPRLFWLPPAVSSRTRDLDFREFDSSAFSISRGGISRSMGNFLEL